MFFILAEFNIWILTIIYCTLHASQSLSILTACRQVINCTAGQLTLGGSIIPVHIYSSTYSLGCKPFIMAYTNFLLYSFTSLDIINTILCPLFSLSAFFFRTFYLGKCGYSERQSKIKHKAQSGWFRKRKLLFKAHLNSLQLYHI